MCNTSTKKEKTYNTVEKNISRWNSILSENIG
jgi:hypothetical protein